LALLSLLAHSGCVQWHSQKGQDKWVSRSFDLDSPSSERPGFYVDLAANHPTLLSNSYVLDTHYHWRGLCIEANAVEYDAALYRAHNRTCALVAAIVSTSDGERVNFLPSGPGGGIVASDTDHALVPEKHAYYVGITRSLVSLLDEHNSPHVIDYLSLDVEGAEARVLSDSFAFDRYTFLSLTVERPPPWLNHRLARHGYLFVQNNKFDSFYIHKSHPRAGTIRRAPFQQILAKCTGSRDVARVANVKHRTRFGECKWPNATAYGTPPEW
jgi:hypothetical protein